MRRLRVLIVDDHPMFRYGLRALLSSDEGIEVVGETASGEEAVELAREMAPDVVLMDIGLPGMSGLEATEAIVHHRPEARVLIISMFEDDSVMRAMQLGARGYILKGAGGEETLRAVRAVAEGGAIFSPSVAERLSRYFQAGVGGGPVPFPELTHREREILDLLARGLTNSGIAERLSLSPKTVRNRVSEIFDKLRVRGRAEAIVRAREAGLGR